MHGQPAQTAAPHPSARSQRGLDWLNFFVADLQTGFGPFIAVDLAWHGWGQGTIGTILTINSVVALASQAPAGMLVDWVHFKRAVVGVSLVLIAIGALLFAFFPSYWPVAIAQTLHGATGATVRLAIAAIGLGLVGHRAYHTRVGRNHRFDSFGNGLTAAAMGGLGQYVSPSTPFLASAGLCAPAFLALYFIRGREIDYRRARAATGRRSPHAAPWRELLKSRRLMIFALCLFLFQFANASLLPLAGERLAANYRGESELVIAALVVVPQIVTALIATLIARKADAWGRKPLLLLGFGALVPNAALFAVAPGPWFLVGVQALGGLTAAVIGILTPLVVADVTAGTGRYNASLGAVGVAGGIGASISTGATGFVAAQWGFGLAFAVLAGVASAGLAAVWWKMPETVDMARSGPES